MEFESYVLAAVTADLDEEPVARTRADVMEFRLDLADYPLEQLRSYAGELPIIATNRVASEGGNAPDTPDRLDTLADAAANPAVAAIDVELASINDGDADELLAAADTHNLAVIASAHDFEVTPPQRELTATLRAACAAGDVGKLTVTATDLGDVLELLEVTFDLTQDGLDVATMSMGDSGRHSRVVAPIYGSRVGYAPVTVDDATAPGQYDLESLRSLLDAVGVG
jgi:3-dehydroquinate dehydratase-1